MPRKTMEYWDRPENQDLRDIYLNSIDATDRASEKLRKTIEAPREFNDGQPEPKTWPYLVACVVVGFVVGYLATWVIDLVL